MTPAPGPHLSPDDVELWLTGTSTSLAPDTSSCARSVSTAPRPSGKSSNSWPPYR